jgi:large subunit ribosomal protein L9
MRVLLRSDVSGLGKRGDLVDVANGYARNYLVPKGLAIKANAGMEAQAESRRRSRDVRDATQRAQAEDVARQLVPTVITVKAKAGSEGKLFGSVTTNDVVEAVREQTGIELDRHDLDTGEHIKTTGTHAVQAKLHSEVQFQITIEVEPV